MFLFKSKKLQKGDKVINVKTGEVLTVTETKLGPQVPLLENIRKFPFVKRRLCFISCTNGETYSNQEIIRF